MPYGKSDLPYACDLSPLSGRLGGADWGRTCRARDSHADARDKFYITFAENPQAATTLRASRDAMRRVRSTRWGSIHESDRVPSFGALDRAPKFSPVPASMRCNSHAKSFSYAGSDSSEEKRIGHDEEVIDPATPSPEIWQESDSIDNKLGPSSSVRQCEVLIDLSTCADMFFRDHVQSSSHRKIAALLRSQLPHTPS